MITVWQSSMNNHMTTTTGRIWTDTYCKNTLHRKMHSTYMHQLFFYFFLSFTVVEKEDSAVNKVFKSRSGCDVVVCKWFIVNSLKFDYIQSAFVVLQRWVWSWQDGKHKKGHSVPRTCCLLPQRKKRSQHSCEYGSASLITTDVMVPKMTLDLGGGRVLSWTKPNTCKQVL